MSDIKHAQKLLNSKKNLLSYFFDMDYKIIQGYKEAFDIFEKYSDLPNLQQAYNSIISSSETLLDYNDKKEYSIRYLKVLSNHNLDESYQLLIKINGDFRLSINDKDKLLTIFNNTEYENDSKILLSTKSNLVNNMYNIFIKYVKNGMLKESEQMAKDILEAIGDNPCYKVDIDQIVIFVIFCEFTKSFDTILITRNINKIIKDDHLKDNMFRNIIKLLLHYHAMSDLIQFKREYENYIEYHDKYGILEILYNKIIFTDESII